MAYYHSDYYNHSVSFSDPHIYDPRSVSAFYAPNYIDYHHQQQQQYGVDYAYYSYSTPQIYYLASSTVNPQINYADLEFNEPEFEEYDPTPYGGGYDIVSTYGKPLPPSNETCYPRSTPNPAEPKPKPEPEPEPEPKSKPEPTVEPVLVPMNVPLPESEPEPVVPEPLESEGYSYPDYGYDYPWPEYDHGYDVGRGGVGYDYYGRGKQVVQVPPCEYDEDVVEFCESIFGDWPCLARIRKQHKGIENEDNKPGNGNQGQGNPWEGCANYFFGWPNTAS